MGLKGTLTSPLALAKEWLNQPRKGGRNRLMDPWHTESTLARSLLFLDLICALFISRYN